MRNSYSNASKDFLDLASEQRLDILFHLMQEKSKISPMAKKLDSTVQEVHRNFERLAKSGFIEKDIDGYYHLYSLWDNNVHTDSNNDVFLKQPKILPGA